MAGRNRAMEQTVIDRARPEPALTPPSRRFAPAAGLCLFGRALGPTAIALGLQFVTFAVTARGLGIGAFGLYSAVTAIAAILIEVLGFGTNDVMVRGVARDPDSFAGYFGLMLLFFGATFAPVLLVGVGLLAYGAGLALPLGVIAVGLAGEMVAARFSSSAEAILVAHGNPAGAAMVRLVTASTRLAAALGYFAVARGLAGWVWVVLGQSLLLAGCLFAYVGRRYGWPRWQWSTRELGAGFAFALNQTARALQGNVDRLILARFVDPAVLGAYSAGARLLMVGLFPIQVLTRMFYPDFFRHGVGGIAATRRYALSRVPAMAATGLGSFVAVAIAAQLLPGVLGHEFQASRHAALLLAMALPLIGLQYLAADTLTGAGHQGLRALLALLASAGFGLGMVLGVRLLGGVTGVVVAFIACHALFLLALTVAAIRVGRGADRIT